MKRRAKNAARACGTAARSESESPAPARRDDTFAMLFFLLAMSNIGAASQVRRGGQPSKKGDVYVQMATNPTAVSLNLIHARRPRRFPSRWCCQNVPGGPSRPADDHGEGFSTGGVMVGHGSVDVATVTTCTIFRCHTCHRRPAGGPRPGSEMRPLSRVSVSSQSLSVVSSSLLFTVGC